MTCITQTVMAILSRELCYFIIGMLRPPATCLLLFSSTSNFKLTLRRKEGKARTRVLGELDSWSIRRKIRGKRIYIRAFIETPDAADHSPMKTLKRKREYDHKTIQCSLISQWRATHHENAVCWSFAVRKMVQTLQETRTADRE